MCQLRDLLCVAFPEPDARTLQWLKSGLAAPCEDWHIFEPGLDTEPTPPAAETPSYPDTPS